MKQINVNLKPLINKLEAILKRGFSRELMAGNYQSVFKGKGLEFIGFREYVPSDDALLIDWKASLKAGKLMVKILQEERDLTVFFLFDVSDSMLFSSHSKLKCEYAAELLGTMAFAMHSVGDKVGMAMFTDTMVKIVPPGIGRHQFYKIVKSLGDPSLYGGKCDINFALKYLLGMNFVGRDAIFFLVSDFIGMKSGWEEAIKLAGLKYDFTAIVVRDPVDMKMPDVSGEVRFGDPFSKNQLLVNPIDTGARYEAEARNQIIRLKAELNKTRSSLLVLDTKMDFTSEMFKFFKMRAKFK